MGIYQDNSLISIKHLEMDILHLHSVLTHSPVNYSQYFKDQQLHLVGRFNIAGLFLDEINNADSALHSSSQGFY